jgi:hypothetical protein
MDKTYNISQRTTQSLLNKLIDETQVSNKSNIGHIRNILKNGLSNDHISYLLNCILSSDTFTSFAIGDYVTLMPPSYHENEKYELDTLIDKGLATKEGLVYGIITGDGSWSSDFDPYCNTMEVNILYYDDVSGDVKPDINKVNTFDLSLISKSKIPFYNKVVQQELF